MATWLLEVRQGYDREKLIPILLEEFKISPFELTVLESLPERPLKIEETRTALKKLHLKPTIGEKSALLILGADNLSLAVANTLLKTLEEPPSYLEICLVAQNPKRLPPTVLSRSQPLDLKLPFSGTLSLPSDSPPEETGEIRNSQLSQRKISLFPLMKLSVDEQFSLAEKVSKEKLTAEYLSHWIEEIKKDLYPERSRGVDKNPEEYKLKIFHLLVANLKLVENSNLNQRLLLENLFLKIKNTNSNEWEANLSE